MERPVGGLERRATLRVERGLSALSYRGETPAAGEAPEVEVVAVSPGLSLLCTPGERPGLLTAPGQVLVVVAHEPGAIDVVMRSTGPGGALPAGLELRRMGAEAEAEAAPAPALRLRPDLPEGGVEFLLRAHVSLRGDIAAPRGHWICGPETPGRIEGIEMRGVAAELPLEYQVASGGRGAGWSPWTPAGAYAGTRGRALPLIGLRVRLLPDAAPGLVLKADGVFLGSSVATRQGREIELVGPTPLDPLVGVRLDFAAAGRATRPAPPTPVRQPSRLRVFRRPAPEVDAAA
ncbi:hypothetical protein D3218_04975 [Aureimonas flava]|uniref:Hydrophobic W protein n=1 Tax=Aureimonas flava TaxID=2320271 RepID=A0A3A1WR59_9HYPH|nr:hypothetical protein [Aureimonas flava]RIY02710.1 hypothetical protein D3218_04975 [Aureimonas flava]